MVPTPCSRVAKCNQPCNNVSFENQFKSDILTKEARPSQPLKTDRDHDLIHAFPPPPQQRSRRELLGKNNKVDGGKWLAFASIGDFVPDNEQQLYAGMSSAASCIVLELPREPSSCDSTKTLFMELVSNGNRAAVRNRNSISTSVGDVDKWRNAVSKSCHRFKPVYTHQFFDDEKVRGYRPTDEAVAEAHTVIQEIIDELPISEIEKSLNVSHSSFSHHACAKYSLSIQVRLAPSCKKSCVILKVAKIKSISVRNPSKQLRCESQKRQARKAATAAACALKKIFISFSDEDSNMVQSDDISSYGDKDEGDDDNDDDDFELLSCYGRKRRRYQKNEVPISHINNSIRRSIRKCVKLQKSKRLLYKDESEDESGSLWSEVESRQSSFSCRRNKLQKSPVREGARRSSRGCVQNVNKSLYTIGESDNDSNSSFSEAKSVHKTFNCNKHEQQKSPASIGIRRSRRRCVQLRESERVLCMIDESECDTNRSKQEIIVANDVRRRSKICVEPGKSKRSLYQSTSDEPEKIAKASRTGLETRPNNKPSSESSMESSNDQRRMGVEKIIKELSRGLPNMAAVLLVDDYSCSVIGKDDDSETLSSTLTAIDDTDSDYLDQPIGNVFREYTREKNRLSLRGSGGIASPTLREGGLSKTLSDSDGKFVMSLADMRNDENACKYHDEVEKLAPWFIEVADCVRMGSTGGVVAGGGYWKVLYLFEKYENDSSGDHPRHMRSSKSHGSARAKYSLAGYMTFFFFTKHNERRTGMVICQAILLPPYQRSGHGTEMMRAAYDIAHGIYNVQSAKSAIKLESAMEIDEIDVESPAAAFVALRNRIDYDLLRSIIERYQTHPLIPRHFTRPLQFSSSGDNLQPGCFVALPEQVLIKVASTLKITPRQVQTAFEIWKLNELEKFIKSISESSLSTASVNRTIASMEACYKSMVKKSLLRTIRKNEKKSKFDLMEREEQQEYLEKCFHKSLVHYRSILWLS